MSLNNHQIEAYNLLMTILKEQPNLLQPKTPQTSSGADVADFCTAFIYRYSESLELLEKGQKPKQ